jgi:tRNA dimethylallyltransferase
MLVAVICGATATGKSALARKIAEANGYEIISADSRQIYRGFKIGTNAPTLAERSILHHLDGFCAPSEVFSPRAYPALVHALIAANPHTHFLVVGGTGLYLKELLFPSPFDRGPTPDAIKNEVQTKIQNFGLPHMYAELLRLDPEGARGLHPNDGYRIAKRLENLAITGESYTKLTGPVLRDPRFPNVPILCLDVERETLYARIDKRVGEMLEAGWLAEVQGLMKLPDWKNLPAFSSLGYTELAAVIEGTLGLPEAIARIQKQTRNYAKRQGTFFRTQLPETQHWDGDELDVELSSVGWNWEAFQNQQDKLKN